jgi:hypothetical protein
VTWRLPSHVLARPYTYAEMEGVTVTSWVERAVAESVESYRTRIGAAGSMRTPGRRRRAGARSIKK